MQTCTMAAFSHPVQTLKVLMMVIVAFEGSKVECCRGSEEFAVSESWCVEAEGPEISGAFVLSLHSSWRLP